VEQWPPRWQTVGVPRFLSPEWFARLEELAPAERVDGFVIEQQVARSGEAPARYHVVIGDGGARVVAGPAERPDLVISSDYPTAAALAQGTLSAQDALTEGRLHFRGDLAAAAARRDEWVGVEALPAALRTETEF